VAIIKYGEIKDSWIKNYFKRYKNLLVEVKVKKMNFKEGIKEIEWFVEVKGDIENIGE